MNIPPRYFPPLLLILACFIRLVYFYQFQENPFFNHLPRNWDQTLYHKGAQALIEGDLLALAPGEANQQSPFYQYFLGLVYFLFGTGLTSAWIAQLFLGVISTFLVYSIALRYMTQGSAFVAAVLFTFYGGNWFYECTLYRASLLTLLILSTFLLLTRFADRPSLGHLIGSALSLSLLTQARANFLLLIPFALAYLWKQVFSGNSSGKKWLAGYLVIFFLASLPLLMWVKQVHGNWGLYDHTGGENLYLANSPGYSVRSYVHSDEYRNLLKNGHLETLPALQLILKDVIERPLDFTKIYFHKIYYYFNDYEVPTTHNYYLSSELSPVLRWGSIPFGVISTLGVSGFFWSWKNWKRLTLIHAFFLGNLLAYLPFLIFSRYRLTMVPFLCIFSALSLQMIFLRFRENNLRILFSTIILMLVLGWFVKTTPLPEGKIRILDYINMSSAYLNNHKPDDDNKAYKYLERSWELSRSLPSDLRSPGIIRMALSHFYFKKAEAYRQREDTAQEIVALRKALYFDFSSATLHEHYARTFIKKGESKKALMEILIALTSSPNSLDLNLLASKIYTERLHPLWGLYHLLQARGFFDRTIPPSLDGSIQSLQQVLELNSLPFDPQKSILKVRDLLAGEILSPMNFPMNLTLPVEISHWKNEEVYDYRLRLHQCLLFESGVSPAIIYYQLGMLEWSFFRNDNSAFYYFEKAWDHGLQTQRLASLLNDLSEKSAARSISWANRGDQT